MTDGPEFHSYWLSDRLRCLGLLADACGTEADIMRLASHPELLQNYLRERELVDLAGPSSGCRPCQADLIRELLVPRPVEVAFSPRPVYGEQTSEPEFRESVRPEQFTPSPEDQQEALSPDV